MRTGECWKCGADSSRGDHCRACGSLQPFPDGIDHFSIFGLPRKLEVDLEDLESRFYALSRRFHPDFYQGGGAQAQAVSLEGSAQVNVAYRTLRDPIARAEYLLESEGLSAGAPSHPPEELLEEIMELQEARQEYRVTRSPELETRLTSALRDLEIRRVALEEELKGVFGKWDRALDGDGSDAEEQRTLLERMKETLATRAYLGPVIRDLREELERS